MRAPRQDFPLGMVLDACPDILDYSKGGIANWRDFLAVAMVVRSMLGISPSAWEAAQSAMGEIPAAIVVAGILQKGDGDHERRRIFARAHEKSWGGRIRRRADADGADFDAQTRKETA